MGTGSAPCISDELGPRGLRLMVTPGEGLGMSGFPRGASGQLLGKREVGNLCPGCAARPRPRPQDWKAWRGNFSRKSWGDAQRGILLPPSPVSTTLVESWLRGESAERKEGNSGGGRRTRNLRWVLEFSGDISVPVFPCGTARRVPKSPSPACILTTSLPSTPLHPPPPPCSEP